MRKWEVGDVEAVGARSFNRTVCVGIVAEGLCCGGLHNVLGRGAVFSLRPPVVNAGCRVLRYYSGT
jgi:hypothetical protein